MEKKEEETNIMEVVGAYFRRFQQKATSPVVAGPMAKLAAYQDWFPAVLAVTIALLTNQNLTAALLAGQAWSLGREKVFKQFLSAVFYLALALVLGPNVALACLLIESQKTIHQDTADDQPKGTLADYVSTYRELACNQALQFVKNVAALTQAKPE